jgi:flagellar biosynthesis/type III secretory pathway protein FliH
MAADPFAFEQLDERLVQERRPPMSRAAAVSEAESLLAAAEAEAERVREQARLDGYHAGHQQAMLELQQQLEPAAQAIGVALNGIQEARHVAADHVEAHAVDLALMLAEKIVGGAIAVQPERVVDVVRGALRLLSDREGVVVVVNPDDFEIVQAAHDDLARSAGGFSALDVQSDRRVHRGGAIVRTAVGEIDATLETKLERAREVLERELT